MKTTSTLINSHNSLNDRDGCTQSGLNRGKSEWQRNALRVCGQWSEQLSSKGKVYFYNCVTEVSQWQKPTDWNLPEISKKELLKISSERRIHDAHSQKRTLSHCQQIEKNKLTFQDRKPSPKRIKCSAAIEPSTKSLENCCLPVNSVQQNPRNSKSPDSIMTKKIPKPRSVPDSVSSRATLRQLVDSLRESLGNLIANSPLTNTSSNSLSANLKSNSKTSLGERFNESQENIDEINKHDIDCTQKNFETVHNASVTSNSALSSKTSKLYPLTNSNDIAQTCETNIHHNSPSSIHVTCSPVTTSQYSHTKNASTLVSTISALVHLLSNASSQSSETSRVTHSPTITSSASSSCISSGSSKLQHFRFPTNSPSPHQMLSSSGTHGNISHIPTFSSCRSDSLDNKSYICFDKPISFSSLNIKNNLLHRTNDYSKNMHSLDSSDYNKHEISKHQGEHQRKRTSEFSPNDLLDSQNSINHQKRAAQDNVTVFNDGVQAQIENRLTDETSPHTKEAVQIVSFVQTHSKALESSHIEMIDITSERTHKRNTCSSTKNEIFKSTINSQPFSILNEQKSPSKSFHVYSTLDMNSPDEDILHPDTSFKAPCSVNTQDNMCKAQISILSSEPDRNDSQPLLPIPSILDSSEIRRFVDSSLTSKFQLAVADGLEAEAQFEFRKFDRLHNVLFSELSGELKKLRALVCISEAKLATHQKRKEALQDLMDGLETRKTLPYLPAEGV